MRRFSNFAAVGAILLVSGAAAAADKPEQPKTKKVCTTIEPAVGRLPAKRVCVVKVVSPAQPQADAAAEPAAAGDPGARAN
jgi:hypothetical protein